MTTDDEQRHARAVRAVARLQEAGRRQAHGASARASELRRRSPLVDAGFRVIERDRESAGTVLGSAIAFRLFLFFVPLLLVLVGLTGIIGSREQADDLNEEAGLGGVMADQIRAAFDQPTSSQWVALLSGVVGVLWTGRSLTRVLAGSSGLAWRTTGKVTTPVRVIGAVIGVMTGVALLTAIVNRIRAAAGVAVAGLSLAAVFAVYVVLIAILMVSLPRTTPDPGAALPGAAFVAVEFVGLQAVSQLYLPGQFADASSLYGGIGVAVVTLGWFFFVGRGLAFAFSLNAALFERLGSVSGLVFPLPVLRQLPRRSAWIREFFGIDERGHTVRPVEPDGTPVEDP
jgi:uncharacterized BrkB/YihY/UPF0761 family membrane protein